MKPLLRIVNLFTGLLLAASPVLAQEHVIKMLNSGRDGGMVFEPAYLSVDIGDTVRFEPTSSGHYVRSLALPDGIAPWNSAPDQPFVVTIAQPGLYLYACPPHLMMAMVGLIQAGEAVNRPRVEEAAAGNRGRMLMNGKRLDALLTAIR